MNKENKNWKDKLHHLREHESPIDLSSEWELLEKRLETKKKRRPVFWLWPFGLGIAVYGLYILSMPTLFTQQKKTNNSFPAGHPSQIQIQTQTKAESKTKDNAITSIEEPNIKYLLSERNIAKDQQEFKYNKNTEIPEIQHSNSGLIKESKSDVAPESSIQDIVYPTLVTNQILESKDSNNKNRIENMAYISHSFATNIQSLHPYSPSIEHFIIQPKNRIKANSWWNINVIGGLQHLSYKPINGIINEIAKSVKQHETPLEFLAAKIAYGKDLGSGIYISSGISYQQLNEKWSETTTDILMKTVENQLTSTYTAQNGIVTNTYGIKEVSQEITTESTRYNSLSSCNVTVSIGKYFNVFNNRLTIEANFGIPVYIGYQGQTTKLQDQIQKRELSESSLQYGFNASYIYPVSGNMAICTGYDYTHLQLKNNLGFSKTHHLNGLSLGLRYYITKNKIK